MILVQNSQIRYNVFQYSVKQYHVGENKYKPALQVFIFVLSLEVYGLLYGRKVKLTLPIDS